MMVVLATARGASAAQRTFITMTLFDHYCAKLHTGLGLDGERALDRQEAAEQHRDPVQAGRRPQK